MCYVFVFAAPIYFSRPCLVVHACKMCTTTHFVRSVCHFILTQFRLAAFRAHNLFALRTLSLSQTRRKWRTEWKYTVLLASRVNFSHPHSTRGVADAAWSFTALTSRYLYPINSRMCSAAVCTRQLHACVCAYATTGAKHHFTAWDVGKSQIQRNSYRFIDP